MSELKKVSLATTGTDSNEYISVDLLRHALEPELNGILLCLEKAGFLFNKALDKTDEIKENTQDRNAAVTNLITAKEITGYMDIVNDYLICAKNKTADLLDKYINQNPPEIYKEAEKENVFVTGK